MLGELDISILDDLYPVVLQVAELHPSSGQPFHSRVLELLSDFFFVVKLSTPVLPGEATHVSELPHIRRDQRSSAP
jgi:hypothetical protein